MRYRAFGAGIHRPFCLCCSDNKANKISKETEKKCFPFLTHVFLKNLVTTFTAPLRSLTARRCFKCNDESSVNIFSQQLVLLIFVGKKTEISRWKWLLEQLEWLVVSKMKNRGFYCQTNLWQICKMLNRHQLATIIQRVRHNRGSKENIYIYIYMEQLKPWRSKNQNDTF